MNLDRVRRQLSVEVESVVQVVSNELGVDLPLWVETKQCSNKRLHIVGVILPVWAEESTKRKTQGLNIDIPTTMTSPILIA